MLTCFMFATVTRQSCNNKQYPVKRTRQWSSPMTTKPLTFFVLLMVLCPGHLNCTFKAKHHPSVDDSNHTNYTASGQVHV